MANKKKSEVDQLSKIITLRCKVVDYVRWEKAAAQHGISLSDMMRFAMNNTKINTKENALAVCELRKTAILLREHLNDKNKLPDFRRLSVENALEKMVTLMNRLMEN